MIPQPVPAPFGNEDSVYLSPAFNKNSSTDWVGFEGLDFDENDISGNVDIPNPGFAADPDGFKPATADSSKRRLVCYFATGASRAWGRLTSPTTTLGTDWNGNFNWYNRPFFVAAIRLAALTAITDSRRNIRSRQQWWGKRSRLRWLREKTMACWMASCSSRPATFIRTCDLLDLYSQADLDAGILPQPVNADYNDNGVVDAADYVLWRNGGPLAERSAQPWYRSVRRLHRMAFAVWQYVRQRRGSRWRCGARAGCTGIVRNWHRGLPGSAATPASLSCAGGIDTGPSTGSCERGRTCRVNSPRRVAGRMLLLRERVPRAVQLSAFIFLW